MKQRIKNIKKKEGKIMEKCYGDYNSKLEFKMLTYLNKNRDTKEGIAVQLKVFNNLKKPTSDTQKHLYKTKKAFDILKQEKEISAKILTKVYRKYKRILSEEELLEIEIFSKISNNDFKNENIIRQALYNFYHIIKQKVFDNYYWEMGVLIFNAIFIQNDYFPVIIHHQTLKGLEILIKAGISIDELELIFKTLIDRSNEYNQKYTLMKLEEIITKILENKRHLEEEFEIQAIHLYGSYAKGEENIYSDIDFAMYSENEEYPSEKKEQLTIFMKNIYQRKVDVVVINNKNQKLPVDFEKSNIRIY